MQGRKIPTLKQLCEDFFLKNDNKSVFENNKDKLPQEVKARVAELIEQDEAVKKFYANESPRVTFFDRETGKITGMAFDFSNRDGYRDVDTEFYDFQIDSLLAMKRPGGS